MTAARMPFYRRLDWWLASLSGLFLGWAIGEFADHGSSGSAWLSLTLAVTFFSASIVVLIRRYRS